MMIFTVKIRRRGLLIALALVVAAAAGAMLFSNYGSGEAAAAVFGRGKSEVRCTSAEERAAYLGKFGWTAEEMGSLEVMIPAEFDGVYETYNAIQTAQGFKLEKYKGEQVTKYSYKVTNFPEEGEVIANLLIYKDRVIAADLSSTELGGFIRGLDNQELPEQKPERT